MITPSYLGDTIEYSSYASNALGALPYGRPAGGREFTSDSEVQTPKKRRGRGINNDLRDVTRKKFDERTDCNKANGLFIGHQSNSRGRHGGREHATSGPIRPIVSRITIHWPSFYNVVTGKTLALPNLIALQHIPLSPAGVIAKRPAPIALPNSCAA